MSFFFCSQVLAFSELLLSQQVMDRLSYRRLLRAQYVESSIRIALPRARE